MKIENWSKTEVFWWMRHMEIRVKWIKTNMHKIMKMNFKIFTLTYRNTLTIISKQMYSFFILSIRTQIKRLSRRLNILRVLNFAVQYTKWANWNIAMLRCASFNAWFQFYCNLNPRRGGVLKIRDRACIIKKTLLMAASGLMIKCTRDAYRHKL